MQRLTKETLVTLGCLIHSDTKLCTCGMLTVVASAHKTGCVYRALIESRSLIVALSALESDDTRRLDWIMKHISRPEARRLGILNGTKMDREEIDSSMSGLLPQQEIDLRDYQELPA